MIKVSICVPVYGVELFMAKTARSLFAQTYSDIEFIFVNDCTKDRSIDILRETLEEFPHRKSQTRIIEHEKNKGLSATRHTAVLHATGDYFFHFDADDYLEPNAIACYVEKVEETQADIVMADYKYIYLDHSIPNYDEVPADKTDYVCRLLTRRSNIHVWGRLIRRRFVMEHNLFAPDGLNVSEDYVLIPRMVYLAKKVAKIDAPLVNYVRYNTTSASTVVHRKGLENTVKAMDILEDFFTTIPDAAHYTEALKEAKLHNKVTLYGLAAKADYAFVRPLYKDIPVWSSSLDLKKKLLLTLASLHLDGLVFRIIRHYIR